jgi:hypothetical protein
MTDFVTDQDGYEEAVLLFDADGLHIEAALTPGQFELFTDGETRLDQFAASKVRAAFAVVGAALSLRAAVFFTFKVDEEGYIEGHFNLPLRYLADNAGPGPDLGTGPVRLACRGQCPVPWHSVNLWEPKGEGENGSIHIVQRTVWRNQLGLKPSGALGKRNNGSDPLPELLEDDGRVRQKALEVRLTDTFGEQGRVNLESLIRQHNQRVSEVTTKYRDELAEQQRNYLEQIRSCREEIQQLRSALRHEQQRSRRLQALLRGEP